MRASVALGSLAVVLLVAFAPVHAQDPVTGALATLQAATVQAQRWQQAQAATRQAVSAQATWAADRQAATAQAMRVEVMATAQAQAVRATDQAIGAQATLAAATVQAHATEEAMQATAQAQSARATDQAYAASKVTWERQERTQRATEWFLYAAFALGLAEVALLAWRAWLVLQAIEDRVRTLTAASRPAPAPQEAEEIVEGEFVKQNQRGLNIHVIDDPVSIEQFEQFVLEHGL